MPAVTIIQALGDGTAKPLAERHLNVLPQEGTYVKVRGSPYRVEAVIHDADRNLILLRVRAVMVDRLSDDEPPRVRVIDHRPQLPRQRQQLPALPAGPVQVDETPIGLSLEDDDEDDFWHYK